jgi:hypothetical protein
MQFQAPPLTEEYKVLVFQHPPRFPLPFAFPPAVRVPPCRSRSLLPFALPPAVRVTPCRSRFRCLKTSSSQPTMSCPLTPGMEDSTVSSPFTFRVLLLTLSVSHQFLRRTFGCHVERYAPSRTGTTRMWLACVVSSMAPFVEA